MDSASIPATMDSASTRLLNIPELALAIALFLDKKDISQLMQASHGLHNMFAPCLYQDFDLAETLHKLLTRRNFMQALSRNAGLVRTIKMGSAFGMTYYDGVMLQKHQQQQSSPEATSSVVQPPSSSTPTGNMERPIDDITEMPPTPLSPFTHLSKLNFVLITSREYVHRVKMRALYKSGELISRLCGILDFSPRLRSLSLSRICINTGELLHHLATTLAGLINLERLSLGLLSPYTDQDRFITPLFHYFPDMLQHLSLRLFFLRQSEEKQKNCRHLQQAPTTNNRFAAQSLCDT